MCFHSHIIYIVCDYLLNCSFHLRLSGNTGAIGFQRLCYGSLINSVGNLPHVGDFLFREPMAGHLMARRQFNQLRFLLLTTFRAVGAAVAEGQPGGRSNGLGGSPWIFSIFLVKSILVSKTEFSNAL